MMTLIRKYYGFFTQGIGWIFSSQLIVSAVGFIFTIVITNALSVTEYGIYKYVIAIASLLIILTASGLISAMTRVASTGNGGEIRYLIWVRTQWALLACLAGLALAGYYALNDNFQLTILMLIIAIGMPISEILRMYQPILQGRRAYKLLSIFDTYGHVSHYTVVAVTALSGANLTWVVASYFISYVVAYSWPFLYAYKKFTTTMIPAAQARMFGIHMSIANSIAVASTHIDKLLVFTNIGAAEAAIYAVAIAPVEILRSFQKSITTFIHPRVAQYKKITFREHLINHILPGLSISIVIAGAYIISALVLLPLFFPKYPEAVVLSQLYAISILGITMFPNTVLEARLATRELYYHKISASFIRVALIVAGLHFYGITGIIVAQVIARLITFMSALIFVYLNLKKS